MRDEHDRGVERDERLLEPLERLDVEVVGGLVEQQQVGPVASARASDARVSSPPEKLSSRARGPSSSKPRPCAISVARSRHR